MNDHHPKTTAIDPSAAPDDSDAQLRSLGYRPELRRVLGGLSSFAIQYSTICFAGAILVSLLVGFGQVGPLMLWTFIGASMLQIVVAFCIAELTSAYPLAGGVYQVVTHQAGRFLGWQTGWLIQIAHVASLALGSVGLAPIVMSWFGVTGLSHWGLVGASAALIAGTTLVNLMRVKIVARINNAGVVFELIASSVIVVGCAVAIYIFNRPHNTFDFLLSSQGVVEGSLIMPLLFSCLLAAFIASGFDVSGTAGEETHDASRSVPKNAIRANILSMIVGSLVLLMLMLSVPSVQGVLDSVSPVKYILDSVLGSPIAAVLEIVAVLALLVNGMVLQLAGARVLWAQARDGAFIGARWVRQVNREGVPVRGVLVTGLVAFLLTLYSSLYIVLAAILAVTWALAYGISVAVGWRARRANKLPERGFHLRFANIVYPVAIGWSLFLVCLLTYQDPQRVGLGMIGIAALGVAVYFTAGKQQRQNPVETAQSDAAMD